MTGLSLLIINGILLCVAYLIYRMDDKANLQQLGLIVDLILIVSAIAEMGYFGYLAIVESSSILYFEYLRYFLILGIMLVCGLYLVIQYHEFLKGQVFENALVKGVILILAGLLVLETLNEIRLAQVVNSGYLFTSYHALMDFSAPESILGIVNAVMIVLVAIILIIFIVKRDLFSKWQKILAFGFCIAYIVSAIVYYSLAGLPFGSFIYGGQFSGQSSTDTDFAQSSNIISVLFESILQNPIVIISIVFMIFGAIPRAFPSSSPYFKFIGNLSISWLPMLIWIMMLTGTIPIPSVISIMFLGFEWFGKLFYLMLVGMVFILVMSMIVVMTSFS